jgi:hypothetical protein
MDRFICQIYNLMIGIWASRSSKIQKTLLAGFLLHFWEVFFGKVKFAVAPFLNNSVKLGVSTLSGIT